MRNARYFLVILFILGLVLVDGCQFFTSQSSPVTPPAGSLQVVFMDVGQADCTIIRSGNSAMIIDAGSNATSTQLVNNIKSRGITKFDIVIGTHPHEDHIGGLDSVINNFDIGAIYMPKVSTTTKTFTDVLNAIKNKGLTVSSPTPGSTFSLEMPGALSWRPAVRAMTTLTTAR